VIGVGETPAGVSAATKLITRSPWLMWALAAQPDRRESLTSPSANARMASKGSRIHQ